VAIEGVSCRPRQKPTLGEQEPAAARTPLSAHRWAAALIVAVLCTAPEA
jgi:hypothetical protein